MEYNEADYLQLSGIQHFRFCRRQWALIHIENQWAENSRTVGGEIMHERAHDSELRERRGDLLITRNMPVASPTLGVSGACDVVEFRRSDHGCTIAGESGSFQPYPVEYKHGAPERIWPTSFSSADRPCASKKCSAATFHVGRSISGRPAGG